MSDLIDWAGAQGVADKDRAEAADFRSDATELRREAQHEFGEADVVQNMGLTDQATELRTDAGHLQIQASDFDVRANLLEEAATARLDEPKLLQEREHVRQRAAEAEGRAGTAQSELAGAGLTEQQKTDLVAQSGAATGEATALHQRADDLTEQISADIHLESFDERFAHEGITGRPEHLAPGQGHPPGTPVDE